jgi:predicted phosphodiesterase
MKTIKKIVALSDTHGSLEQFKLIKRNNIQGDLFVHAGDFSKYSK